MIQKSWKTQASLCMRVFQRNFMELGKLLWEQDFEYWKQNKSTCLKYRSIIVRDHYGVR